jgi:putative SOS response-associated peptidase YedK
MCGRYGYKSTAPTAAELLRATIDASLASWSPPGEVFPTNNQPICTADGRHRRLTLARWGWKRDFMKSKPLINARSDKLAISKLWRPALAHRRCLVPATCWYE